MQSHAAPPSTQAAPPTPQETTMLNIDNLQVAVSGNEILHGITLHLPAGEVHALMGPNGSGKSTLACALAGKPGYQVTGGTATFRGTDLLAQLPEARARAGLFLGFQYPVELPGVSNAMLLKQAVNARRRQRGETEMDAMDFLVAVKERMAFMEMDETLLERGVNEGFSGGEKKRNEILQMLMLEPDLAILDETDSGLDIDALQVVARGINHLRSPSRAVLLITHYQRLLDHVAPDRVHVLADGRIVRSGGPELAKELEARGYGWLTGDVAGVEAR